MANMSDVPLVRLVVPLISGITLFLLLSFPLTQFSIVIACTLFLVISILDLNRWRQHYHLRWIFGLNTTLFLVFTGYILAQNHVQIYKKNHFSHHQSENDFMRITLIAPISEKPNSYQLEGKVTHLVNEQRITKTEGKILLYLPKDSIAADLKYGDVLLARSKYQEVVVTKNPGVFDFKKFLAHRNIYHVAFLRSAEWHCVGINEGNFLIRAAHRLRDKALITLEKNHISGKEFSVVSALLLGYKEYLDEDLQREFAGAGAMHILCVSGLHVGIIFLALSLIFYFLTKFKNGPLIRTILIIMLLWFYAAITGFSPSVLRATTMFSFLAIGLSFKRHINIYNSLAASALVLVLSDPFIITRIGFQLSYLAVISIVALQPLIYRQLYFRNKILSYTWGIVAVSIAAQLGTGPLAIYYFNLFPNYFILTNIIVIPLAGLIINTGLLFFILSPFAVISDLAGVLLSWLVYLLHTSVRFIEGLPYSAWHNAYLTLPETILILLIFIILSLFWIQVRKSMIVFALGFSLLLALSISVRLLKSFHQQKIVVYHIPYATAIDLISGKQCYFLSCDQVMHNPKTIEYNIKANRLKSGILPQNTLTYIKNTSESQINNNQLFQKGPFVQFNNHTIMLLDEDIRTTGERLISDSLNVLIISSGAFPSMQSISVSFPAQRYVIDSSNSYYRTQRLIDQCDSLKLNCWAVQQKGAFSMASR
jgi:competence protein ComEC